MAIASQISPQRMRALTVALVILALALGLFRLGSAPVYIGNEAREGVYARAMLETGNWILPTVHNHVENGEIIPDKPPLFHWIAASSAWLRTAISTVSFPTGLTVSQRFDEIDSRMPSLLCSTALVWVMLQRGRRMIGDRAALLAAASLITSSQFVEQAAYGRVDMTLALFMTTSMLLLGEALLDGSHRALYCATVCVGLAVLSKGPIGLILPAITSVAWIAIESVQRRSLCWCLELPWIRAGLLGLILPLSWYVWAYEQGGMAFVRSQLLNENLHQFTGGNGSMRLMYYVGPWLADSFPWNLLGLAGVFLAWRERDRRSLFCVVWWISFLGFFQAASYKRAAYLLPALPAGMLMCGWWLDRMLPHDLAELRELASRWRSHLWKPAVSCGVVIFAAGAVLVCVQPIASYIQLPISALDGGIGLLGIAGSLASLMLIAHFLRASRPWSALFALFLGLTCALRGVIATGDIVIARRSSPKLLVQRLLATLPPTCRVTLRGFNNDVSLLPLFYFRDLTRIVVVPDGTQLPQEFSPGFYLFTRDEWTKLNVERTAPTDVWLVHWTDDLLLRPSKVPVLLVEKRS